MKMPADGNSRQRIIHGKFSGNVQLHGEILLPAHVKRDPQIAGTMDVSDIFRPDGSLRIFDPIRLDPAVRRKHDILRMRIVQVEDSCSALLKEQTLAVEVLCEISMLVRADMVRRNVRKDTDLKFQTGCPVHHERLRGYLHDRTVHPRLDHIMEILLHDIRFGCRVQRMDVGIADDHLDRPDETGLMSCVVEDRLHHVGRRGLSFRSCDPDDRDLLRRIVEPGCGNERQRPPGTRHGNNRHLSAGNGHIMIVLYHNGTRTGRSSIPDPVMGVKMRADDTDKYAAFAYFSGIINDLRYILPDCSLKNFVIQSRKKLF